MTDQLQGQELFPFKREAGHPFDLPSDLTRRREEEPVSRVPIWDGSTPWLVTRHADVKSVLSDPRVSMNYLTPGMPPENPFIKVRRQKEARESSGLSMDGALHAQLRRVLTPLFTVKRLSKLRPKIQQIADELIDNMLAGPKPVDFVESFARPLPMLVICELLGVRYEDREMFKESAERMMMTSTTEAESMELITKVHAYFGELAELRKREPGDDVFSALVERMEAGDITLDHVKSLAVVLVIAGHDTTVNMIAMSTLALFDNPEQLAELRANTEDPVLVANAVEEMLRYLTLTHIGRRRAIIEDIEIDGKVMRKGEGVICAENAANRDPAVFPNPEQIDFHQEQTREHLAFGYGVHQCIGQQLARFELQAAFSTLHRRIPTLQFAGSSLDSLPYKDEFIVYGVDSFPVTW
ncbi:cytochrome P450 [Granulicoccus phenolivorans]|uniref:cytochrome P450 n=1 Tax=Granulicoccus phenolivorans TaxID=266854 RepID=UPI000426E0FD|nr:cytochrome P450 [Granulicoccus phenolivorans]